VRIVDFAFTPSTLEVRTGTTVVWTNEGGMVHTVTADDGGFDSGDLASGRSFPHPFPTPGQYAYHCTHHPSMTGLVRVS
jgi:plastocyanin